MKVHFKYNKLVASSFKWFFALSLGFVYIHMTLEVYSVVRAQIIWKFNSLNLTSKDSRWNWMQQKRVSNNASFILVLHIFHCVHSCQFVIGFIASSHLNSFGPLFSPPIHLVYEWWASLFVKCPIINTLTISH